MPCRAWKPSFTGNTWSLLSAIRASWGHSKRTRRCVRLARGELRKATGSRGLHLLLKPTGTWGLAWAQGPHWEALSHNEISRGLTLERVRRVGSSFYICFNTCLLGTSGKIAQLDEHLAWVDVFMDLGAGHWLLFLPFNHISVGNCIRIKQTQVSFQSNFKNKFKLWCWASPMNGDPYLSPKLLIEERTLAIGLVALWSRGLEKGETDLQRFSTSRLCLVLWLPQSVSARIFTDCKSNTQSLGNFKKPGVFK